MQRSTVRVVPLTARELEEIQLIMTDRILDKRSELMEEELRVIRGVVEKCHKYQSVVPTTTSIKNVA